MGQAKRRGSFEQRVAQAKVHINALRPAHIVCNECQHRITAVDDLDIRRMPGLTAAFAGVCPQCTSVTYAMSGDPATVKALMETIADRQGRMPLLGSQEAGQSAD